MCGSLGMRTVSCMPFSLLFVRKKWLFLLVIAHWIMLLLRLVVVVVVGGVVVVIMTDVIICIILSPPFSFPLLPPQGKLFVTRKNICFISRDKKIQRKIPFDELFFAEKLKHVMMNSLVLVKKRKKKRRTGGDKGEEGRGGDGEGEGGDSVTLTAFGNCELATNVIFYVWELFNETRKVTG